MPKDGTATRERILDAAEHLVIENGFAATSVDQVIRAAGTSKGAFFHHFDSKLDLARALTDGTSRRTSASSRAPSTRPPASRTPPSGSSPSSRFRGPGRRAMSAQSQLPLHRGADRAAAVPDGTADLIRHAIDAWRWRSPTFFAPRSSAVPDLVDVDALADHVFVTFEGAFLLCRSPGNPQPHARPARHLPRACGRSARSAARLASRWAIGRVGLPRGNGEPGDHGLDQQPTCPPRRVRSCGDKAVIPWRAISSSASVRWMVFTVSRVGRIGGVLEGIQRRPLRMRRAGHAAGRRR